MFCSTSVWIHLLRGLAAAALIATAVFFSQGHPILIALLIIGAMLLLRGCPMCWLMGLFETMRNQKLNNKSIHAERSVSQ